MYNYLYNQPILGNTIQTIQQQNPPVSCFYVNDKADLQTMNINLGTVYIGINKRAKEIYVRSWNNDGNIGFDTYSLVQGNKEVSDTQKILNKLNMIEERLNESDVKNDCTTVYDGTNEKQPDVGTSQSVVERKDTSTAI